MYILFCVTKGLVKGCKSLRRVNLSDSYWLGSSHLVDLLSVHPGLTHLDLTGCNGPQMQCDFIDITKCQNLTSVRLRGCDWLTADFLSSLVRYNRNLRRLVLADCYRISDEAVESMFEFLTVYVNTVVLEEQKRNNDNLTTGFNRLRLFRSFFYIRFNTTIRKSKDLLY